MVAEDRRSLRDARDDHTFRRKDGLVQRSRQGLVSDGADNDGSAPLPSETAPLESLVVAPLDATDFLKNVCSF